MFSRLTSTFSKNRETLMMAGVTPFMVFDGIPLPAKANESAKRQR
jgi:hypothetical protein